MYKMSCLRYSQFEVYLRGSKSVEIILNKFFKRKIEMIFSNNFSGIIKSKGRFCNESFRKRSSSFRVATHPSPYKLIDCRH